MRGINITPGGAYAHGDVPTHYNVYRNGKRIRIMSLDLRLMGDETSAEIEKRIEEYLDVAFGPLESEIIFQKVN